MQTSFRGCYSVPTGGDLSCVLWLLLASPSFVVFLWCMYLGVYFFHFNFLLKCYMHTQKNTHVYTVGRIDELDTSV